MKPQGQSSSKTQFVGNRFRILVEACSNIRAYVGYIDLEAFLHLSSRNYKQTFQKVKNPTEDWR